MSALPYDEEVYPRPEGLDDWDDDHFVAFSDNLNHHLLFIVREVGRPLREVFWLWYRVIDNIIQDEPMTLRDFVIREWLWYARQMFERRAVSS